MVHGLLNYTVTIFSVELVLIVANDTGPVSFGNFDFGEPLNFCSEGKMPSRLAHLQLFKLCGKTLCLLATFPSKFVSNTFFQFVAY